MSEWKEKYEESRREVMEMRSVRRCSGPWYPWFGHVGLVWPTNSVFCRSDLFFITKVRIFTKVFVLFYYD